MQELETDYLVVGAGAVGMAFVDTLLAETDADVVLVDRNAKPGGHWTQAYPFVTLHQPSAFYGVSSRELSKGTLDRAGLNKGLMELATGAEVCAYYDDVLQNTLLPSGRVRWFPMSNYSSRGEFVSRLTGTRTRVTPRRRTVDATFLNTSIPLTHMPSFDVADGVRFIPPNHLPDIDGTAKRFVVIGGGKTGIDTCLWLLQHGVDAGEISWVVSRDAWLLNRRNTQPSEDFFFDTMGAQAAQYEAIAEARSVTDLFDRLEAAGYFLRLDPDVRPSMFHAATVSAAELDALRQIPNVVRLGHVTALEPGRMVLERGEVPSDADTLYIDCSASAIKNLDMKPVFEDGLITPQTVRPYQPAFSAAFVAHAEAAYNDDATRNEICRVVPLPNHDIDYLYFTAAMMRNQKRWSEDPALKAWLLENRLDGFSKLVAGVRPGDEEKLAVLARIGAASGAAVTKLMQFIGELERKRTAGEST